jgi:hypothetical protein
LPLNSPRAARSLRERDESAPERERGGNEE